MYRDQPYRFVNEVCSLLKRVGYMLNLAHFSHRTTVATDTTYSQEET